MISAPKLPRDDIREGEKIVSLPHHSNAEVYFIGRIHTPFAARKDCPRRGDMDGGPLCRIDIFEPWQEALLGIGEHSHVQILYWMHLASRDHVWQCPRHDGVAIGTFSIRSPNRPNPIASSIARLIDIQPHGLIVRGLDCVDGTPLIDIKPERCPNA
jgi:tRNA-Thr(GGU) m(6)t(6)A37 methyltransferase TsaA